MVKELPRDVKAWVLGMTGVGLALKAVEEPEIVTLASGETDVGLSAEMEETPLVTPVLVLDSGLDVLVPAAPASEAPAPEDSVVPALRLDAVDSVKMTDGAF